MPDGGVYIPGLILATRAYSAWLSLHAWVGALLEKKWRVLRRTILAHWLPVGELNLVQLSPAQRSNGISSLTTDLSVYAKMLFFFFMLWFNLL